MKLIFLGGLSCSSINSANNLNKIGVHCNINILHRNAHFVNYSTTKEDHRRCIRTFVYNAEPGSAEDHFSWSQPDRRLWSLLTRHCSPPLFLLLLSLAEEGSFNLSVCNWNEKFSRSPQEPSSLKHIGLQLLLLVSRPWICITKVQDIIYLIRLPENVPSF